MLTKLDCESFDERIICAFPPLRFEDDAHVHIEFIDVLNIGEAHKSLLSALHAPQKITALNIAWDTQSLGAMEGDLITWREYCSIALNLDVYGAVVLTYRLDWESPLWTWDQLLAITDLGHVRLLTIGDLGFSEIEPIPPHIWPHVLLRHMHALTTVVFADSNHMSLLASLPHDNPIEELRVTTFGVLEEEASNQIVKWGEVQRERGRCFTLVLRGQSWVASAARGGTWEDRLVLDPIRALACVRDERICRMPAWTYSLDI